MPIDNDLLQRLQPVKRPEDFYDVINASTIKRKPYMDAVAYWVALGRDVPQISPTEISYYETLFKNIHYARERLEISGPNFPYMTLLRFMIHTHEDASDSMKFFLRFFRVLRCPNRYNRYRTQFLKCFSYVVNNERY